MKLRELSSRTALITGATSGLGVEFARILASVGCDLILVGSQTEQLGEMRLELTNRYHVTVKCITMDLATADSTQKLVAALSSGIGEIDILINNAGLGLFGDFASVSSLRLRQMLELDMLVPPLLTRLFLPGMIERNFGYILHVASTGILQPSSTYAAYAAARSSVMALCSALHYELRRTAVRCTVLCPGITRSDFFGTVHETLPFFHRLTMMDGAAVARIGLSGMLKGRCRVVAGWHNALAIFAGRFLPRQMIAAIAHRLIRERTPGSGLSARRPATA